MSTEERLTCVFNCVNLMAAVALTTAGGMYYSKISYFTDFTNSNINLIPSLIISVGVILVAVSLLTLYFLAQRVNCENAAYVLVILFTILLLMQLVIGIYGCVLAKDRHEKMLKEIQRDMRKDFLKHDVSARFSDVYNSLQENIECCGVYGPQDYEPNPQLPASCCAALCLNKYCENRRLQYTTGCAIKVYALVVDHIQNISLIVLGISVLQVIGVVWFIKMLCANEM